MIGNPLGRAFCLQNVSTKPDQAHLEIPIKNREDIPIRLGDITNKKLNQDTLSGDLQ